MHAACNHTAITYLCTLVDGRHRWYGCEDCGHVFEVAENTMLTVEAAGALVPEDREWRNQEQILRFRSRHAPPAPPREVCLACEAPSVGSYAHTCARFKNRAPGTVECRACAFADPNDIVHNGPHHQTTCSRFREMTYGAPPEENN